MVLLHICQSFYKHHAYEDSLFLCNLRLPEIEIDLIGLDWMNNIALINVSTGEQL